MSCPARPLSLHAKLTEIVGKKVAASADWPKTSEKFGNELRRLAPQLRLHGMSVSFERRNEGRIITLTSERAPIEPPPDDCTEPATETWLPIYPLVPILPPTCCNC